MFYSSIRAAHFHFKTGFHSWITILIFCHLFVNTRKISLSIKSFSLNWSEDKDPSCYILKEEPANMFNNEPNIFPQEENLISFPGAIALIWSSVATLQRLNTYFALKHKVEVFYSTWNEVYQSTQMLTYHQQTWVPCLTFHQKALQMRLHLQHFNFCNLSSHSKLSAPWCYKRYGVLKR